MVNALFDTNILIDFLNAVPEARQELQRYPTKGISIVTWMEVLVGAPEGLEAPTRAFLDEFDLYPLDAAIAQSAVDLRKTRRIKSPDAIIQATAQIHNLLLVTRNTKDFPGDNPGIRVPYRL